MDRGTFFGGWRHIKLIRTAKEKERTVWDKETHGVLMGIGWGASKETTQWETGELNNNKIRRRRKGVHWSGDAILLCPRNEVQIF